MKADTREDNKEEEGELNEEFRVLDNNIRVIKLPLIVSPLFKLSIFS